MMVSGTLPAESAVSDLSELYRQMVLIRHFEEETLRLATEGFVSGLIHPYTGQEATAVGALAYREPSEWVVSFYRCHGHALASGMAPEALLREILDRSGGVCGGRAGSKNVCDRSHNFLLASSIVASQLAIATGVAFSEMSSGSGKAVIVFCGDGAIGAGIAYESLTIALRFGLPLLVVCEDNGWQDHTLSKHVAYASPDKVLQGLGLRTHAVDGNDVEEVAAAAKSALRACREGNGPQAIVAATYLRDFHSQWRDLKPSEFRDPDDVERWRRHDPIELAATRLRDAGVDVERLRTLATQAVDDAVAGALAAPMVKPESALAGVTAAVWPQEYHERWSM